MPNHSILLKIRRKPALITAAVCLLAVFIAMTVYLCLPMPEGAALDGFDLSGKPYWKARAEARTIRPALVREGKLLRRGTAACRMERSVGM